MANLLKYDPDLVDMVDEDEGALTSFHIYEESLSVVHSEDSVFILGQRFNCSVSDITDKKQMVAFFPDRLAIRTKANNYTTGITNKQRFKDNLEKLHAQGRMEEAAYLELGQLIKDAHCPPVKLLERLFRMGHQTVAKDLDFYDEDPLLEKSIDLLIKFIGML
jgi:hypothetical protein